MDTIEAVAALSALAQETRLAAFRALVVAGEEGVAAGVLAQQLRVPHNTLSAHLASLTRAGLVDSRREGRSIIYAAAPAGIRALLDFLLRDCCRGRPETCAPLLAAVLPALCRPQETQP